MHNSRRPSLSAIVDSHRPQKEACFQTALQYEPAAEFVEGPLTIATQVKAQCGSFDYGQFPPDVRRLLVDGEKRIMNVLGRAIIQANEDLIAIMIRYSSATRSSAGLSGCDTAFGMSASTARNYMAAAI